MTARTERRTPASDNNITREGQKSMAKAAQP